MTKLYKFVDQLGTKCPTWYNCIFISILHIYILVNYIKGFGVFFVFEVFRLLSLLGGGQYIVI